MEAILGIDLGTTNSVLAYTRLDEDAPRVELLSVPQLVAAGTVESRTTLPSFAYLAGEHEASGGAFDLPWQSGSGLAVGELARRQAAEVPDRTVGAAKSWLCHSRVDRHQPILPWNAPAEVPKISPVTASQRYLEHLVAAWEAAFPDAPLARQRVVLTVPASFDASARELTREAALAAGLPEDLLLLEEPQAAIYAWLGAAGDRWRRMVSVGDTLLVCDVGGGTTDLSLVAVTEEDGQLVLQRMAVGNHLLVGGDNMDLALAHHVAGRFAEQGVTLDPWQSVALWHSCRNAKESLLTPEGPEKHPIAVLGRGSKLIGGTVSVEVDRQAVGELLVDGFLPRCQLTERPARRRASGFQEIGLPFESDTAVTRHLAAFLQAHGDAQSPVLPTHVLLNGGVFKAEVFRRLAGEGNKRFSLLEGKTCVNMFFEDSTRTRTSFTLAARRLGAATLDFSSSTSSLSKGETVIDTAKNIQAMGVDVVVVRHRTPGTPHLLAQNLRCAVINAGDGPHEHPTQGLLDIMTIRRLKGRIEGLTVAMVGDIAHSRTARSNIWGLKKLGAHVIVCGPSTLVSTRWKKLGVEYSYSLDDIIPRCDVLNLLRIQFERQYSRPFPSVREYAHLYAMNRQRMDKTKDDILIIAPGPINRGVEVTAEVADGPHSAILEQVTNGVAVRMAVLWLVTAKKG